MRVGSFRELQAYRRAFDCAMRVFHLSQRSPREERYSLVDQVRRSSRSVCANIAEAWRKRRYPASFVSKLSDADAEATETQVWLDMALACGYLDAEIHAELIDQYDHLCAQLVRTMTAPEQWCATPGHHDGRK